MLRIVFLCSGGGGNLRFITKAIELGWVKDAIVCGVITESECGASQFATESDIFTTQIDFSNQNQELKALLKTLAPEIIITTVHKIITPEIVDLYKGKLINLHYSLLPAFSGKIGTNPVKYALQYGAKFIGTTVHLVDANLDMGQPLIQTAIPVEPTDNTQSIMDLVFRCGCIALLNGIQIICHQHLENEFDKRPNLKVKDRIIICSPKSIYYPEFKSEHFWQKLKIPHVQQEAS